MWSLNSANVATAVGSIAAILRSAAAFDEPLTKAQLITRVQPFFEPTLGRIVR